MTDLKKKFTVNRDDEKTFKRVFKNGEELIQKIPKWKYDGRYYGVCKLQK